jgi:signal transduction histidine kinase/ActR/RegA family two-component response regulator
VIININDNDGVSDSDNATQPDDISQGKDRRLTARDRRRRKNAAIDDEATALICETCIMARGNAVDLREDSVHLREEDATLREQGIREIQTASDYHMLMLQQVNAHLVITTLEAKKLAEQLQTTKDQMEIAKSAAEKANRTKSEFLSSMSHELRTPLNAILGFAQLLEIGKPPLSTSQMLRLQEIIKAGWYLLKLVNEILDLALIESGKLSLSLETVSLHDVLLECVTIVQPQAQQHGIKLTLLPFDNASLVYADHTRVKQVLINLLSNAVKYNREQGMVEVACAMNNPKTLCISVKDSGAGLPPEKLMQLFQPFNRLGQEHGTEEGTGIGLMISKRLIELMGGNIGVESTVGVGSVFWIELPLDVPPPSVAGDTLPSKALVPQAEGNTAPHTLLYVEDNPANLLLVEQIISEQRHLTLLSAHHGYHGIALAKAHLPEVILMDINLPGISGIQALEILHEDPMTAHIPVIALSANAMPRDVEKGLKAGFFRYLTKPIKVNELMNALDDALKSSE